MKKLIIVALTFLSLNAFTCDCKNKNVVKKKETCQCQNCS
jgi:hypothetical protein